MPRLRKRISASLERFSQTASVQAGSSWAFLIAAGIILVWALMGPVFGYSDTWQLVINTGTTIVTFLMVFLIQRSQNKEARAIELKLDEIVAALEGASNRLIDVEDLSEAELEVLRKHYRERAGLAKKERSLTESHSIEEAATRHAGKTDRAGSRSRPAAVRPARRSSPSLPRTVSSRRA